MTKHIIIRHCEDCPWYVPDIMRDDCRYGDLYETYKEFFPRKWTTKKRDIPKWCPLDNVNGNKKGE